MPMTITPPPPAPSRLDEATFRQRMDDFLAYIAGALVTDINNIASAGLISTFAEGTFTPVLEGTTTAGVATPSGTPAGRYQRIGQICHFHLRVTWTAHTGTGNMQISGLPFTSAATNYTAINVVSSNVAFTAGSSIKARVLSNSTVVGIVQEPSGGGALQLVPMDTAGDLILSGSYVIA